MNRKVRVDIPESFYRPWNKEADDFFPCQHCKCRHEEGVEWDCPYGESTLADELIDQEKDENELIYVDNNLLNPEWVLTKGFHTSKGRTYRNRSLEYKDGVLSYIPLPLSDLKFPLLSFELAEGPRFAVQYFLRVRRNGIIAAIEFAEEIGEMLKGQFQKSKLSTSTKRKRISPTKDIKNIPPADQLSFFDWGEGK